MALQLQQRLRDVGSKLENPPVSKDSLIKLLKQAAACLSELDQSPLQPMLEAMQPCLNAIVKPELLKHHDRDVKVLVATCICEITRITAPEAPYSDDVLRDIFHLIVGTFSGLGDINSPSFGRRVVILETLARYRSCVVMLDLECDGLVTDMFSTFLTVVSDDHPESVFMSMQTIMTLLVDESEDIQENLLFILLSVLGRGKKDVSLAARRLAMNVIEHCAGKLEPYINQFLVSAISGDNSSLSNQLDYHEVIYDIYHCAPQILHGIVPYMTGELLTDTLVVRLKSVDLLGRLFALSGHAIPEAFQSLFSEFLKRLTDRAVEIRVSVIEHVKNCLLSNPFRAEASDIISALSDRLLDYDENVRKQVVAAVYDVAHHATKSIPAETFRLVAERLRDKSLLVKRYTMERLAELHRQYCLKCSDGSDGTDEFDWIPRKILRCFYDKDFRSEAVEVVLSGSLFPTEFSIKNRVKYWITVFSRFEKVEIKALEQVLMQKQRLQQEMQRYLSLRQKYQDGDGLELQKKIAVCFRAMSRSFNDPVKAEEHFQILNQLKDANIWKILTSLLDHKTTFHQAWMARDDLLKILGEKHPLFDFLSTLSLNCSYLLFNKEHVKEILLEASLHISSGNTKLLLSCMNLLVLLASFFPPLLNGVEENLVHLLKEDNEIIKEGIAHVLSKAGGTIRDQLAMTSSSVDLLLERLCLEGSRKQAKYSVQALAAITKDDGLKSLSVLYKRLVDMLEKRTHLPAVLQSLGCIAQTAMPVFETREEEIVAFVAGKVLECSNKAEDNSKTEWDDRSDLCLLKIFGIKTLVKSYLPVKDAHRRLGIGNLLDILKNILTFGEISKDIESSAVDKAHLRLASAKAVLRLSKYWDQKIPIDLFHLTLRTSEDIYPQVRKLFLAKVHQYIKERLLDVKYACAFLFTIFGSPAPAPAVDFKENKNILVEIVEMCHRESKTRQPSMQGDAFPDYIVTYLVHALAHHSSFPNIGEPLDVQAFEPIYRQLHLFLSILVHRGDGGQSEISEQEIVPSIISIFESIKYSEDVVDGMKSKNSHAVCDLGLSITKHLVRNRADFTGCARSTSLPPVLYRPLEKDRSDGSVAGGEHSWLAADDILTHFESSKDHLNTIKDEKVVKDGEEEGNEESLGTMMKLIKSRRIKKKEVSKRSTSHDEIKDPQDALDILGVVREIDLDNLERSKNLEPEFENDREYFGSEEINHQNGDKKLPGSRIRKIKKISKEMSRSGPKKRKQSRQTDSWDSTKRSRKAKMEVESHIHYKNELPLEKDKMESSNDSELLISCLPTNKNFSSKGKKKGPVKSLIDNVHVAGDADNHELKKSTNLMEPKTEKLIVGSNRSIMSVKKRKRRSIAVLGKCTLKQAEKEDSEIIGHRIKIWWPLDKLFYEGVVQSYDPRKKKHSILYDDGDVEILQLDKERWELISNGDTPRKLLKSPSHTLHREMPSKSTGGNSISKGNKSSITMSLSPRGRKKVTPKRDVKHDEMGTPECRINLDSHEAGRRDTSNTPNANQLVGSEVGDRKTCDSEGKQATLAEVVEKIEQATVVSKQSEGEEQHSDIAYSEGSRDSDDEPLGKWKLAAGKVAGHT